MSDTKQVRRLLKDAIKMLRTVTRMVVLAEKETYRKNSGLPRAPRTAKKMTPELEETLADLKIAHPEIPNREIGRMHGVDGGRVSKSVQKRKGIAFAGNGHA